MFQRGKDTFYPSRFPYPDNIFNSVDKDIEIRDFSALDPRNLLFFRDWLTKFAIFPLVIDDIPDIAVHYQCNLRSFLAQLTKFTIFPTLFNEFRNFFKPDQLNSLFSAPQSTKFAIFSCSIRDFMEPDSQNSLFSFSLLAKFAIFGPDRQNSRFHPISETFDSNCNKICYVFLR